MVLALAVRFMVDPVIEGRNDLEIRGVLAMPACAATVLPIVIHRLDLALELPHSDSLYIF